VGGQILSPPFFIRGSLPESSHILWQQATRDHPFHGDAVLPGIISFIFSVARGFTGGVITN